MKYMGSKNRIAKHILPIILKDRKPEQWYVEPFVGGANTIDKVSGKRIGSDNNIFLIELFKGLQKNIQYPEEITRELYNLARDVYNKKETRIEHQFNFSPDIIGWFGFMASANGRFFEGGFSGVSKTKSGTIRNYIDESIRGIKKQIPLIKNVNFIYSDYKSLDIPENSLIYCDPPYEGTKQYSTSKNFNHLEFWNWCRCMKKQGHTIFVSEYNAPEDFVCVWEKEVKSSLSANGKIGSSKKSTEKLFTL